MIIKRNIGLFDSRLLLQAVKESFTRLDPAHLIRNPVIFIVAFGAFFTTLFVFTGLFIGNFYQFDFQIALWLWFTVLFANFSEAIAEGRGKAQAESLRSSRIK
jgi:K+-transporting ATPase ATPase B chain